VRNVSSRTLLWLAVAGAWAAIVAPDAGAATATINGSPLTITASDRGSIQVSFAGSATGEFTPQPSEPAYAGFTAAVGTPAATSLVVFSYTAGGGNLFTPASPAPTVTQNGNQFILTANFDGITSAGGPVVHVAEQIVYVNGSTDIAVSYAITNTVPVGSTSGTLHGRFFESADLNVAGNDTGTGFFTPSPVRQVGGVNPLGNGAAGLLEVTPWTAYQEGVLSTIQNIVNSAAAAPPSFDNTVNPAVVDSAVGVQWDLASLTQGSSTGESVVWHFARTTPLQLVAAQPTQTVGKTATVTVTARNGDGSPTVGRPVRYAITGANPGTGAVTTAADGTAAITWTGAKTGVDTLTAFVDLDGNGVRNVNTEPQSTATVTWTAAPPLPPPVPGKSVNVSVVSGQVFVKLPGRGARATGPAKGFLPLTGPLQIPVGSQLDTKKGRVALVSAADTGGQKTQKSDFYNGIFQVKQTLPKKKPKKPTALVTDIVLKGQIARSQCAPLKGARSAAVDKKKGPKSVLGKLWGNGKGKYRTTGKYSSATVRGTIWLTQDECDGTLTKVTRGTVQVRDFKRKKTVTVKAGHSYLARAARAASKSRRNK
jgi:hypothetical protein